MKGAKMRRRSLRNIPAQASLACAALGVLLCGGVARAASGDAFAWLEDESQARYIAVERQGKAVSYDSSAGLQACDVVKFSEGASAGPPPPIYISKVDGSRVRLNREKPLKISCSSGEGVTQQVLAFLQSIVHGSNIRMRAIAVTKGEAPCSTAVDVPLLAEKGPIMLVAGRPSLLVAWTGSSPPVNAEMRSADGTIVGQARAVREHVLEMKASITTPGQYTLKLEDACNTNIGEDDVEVVPLQQRPAMPDELASLAEPQRTLFYADYLVALKDGRWGLEALQVAGSLPRDNPLVEGWLEQWTGGMR
jgi:hypothetical protein